MKHQRNQNNRPASAVTPANVAVAMRDSHFAQPNPAAKQQQQQQQQHQAPVGNQATAQQIAQSQKNAASAMNAMNASNAQSFAPRALYNSYQAPTQQQAHSMQHAQPQRAINTPQMAAIIQQPMNRFQISMQAQPLTQAHLQNPNAPLHLHQQRNMPNNFARLPQRPQSAAQNSMTAMQHSRQQLLEQQQLQQQIQQLQQLRQQQLQQARPQSAQSKQITAKQQQQAQARQQVPMQQQARQQVPMQQQARQQVPMQQQAQAAQQSRQQPVQQATRSQTREMEQRPRAILQPHANNTCATPQVQQQQIHPQALAQQQRPQSAMQMLKNQAVAPQSHQQNMQQQQQQQQPQQRSPSAQKLSDFWNFKTHPQSAGLMPLRVPQNSTLLLGRISQNNGSQKPRPAPLRGNNVRNYSAAELMESGTWLFDESSPMHHMGSNKTEKIAPNNIKQVFQNAGNLSSVKPLPQPQPQLKSKSKSKPNSAQDNCSLITQPIIAQCQPINKRAASAKATKKVAPYGFHTLKPMSDMDQLETGSWLFDLENAPWWIRHMMSAPSSPSNSPSTPKSSQMMPRVLPRTSSARVAANRKPCCPTVYGQNKVPKLTPQELAESGCWLFP